MSSHRASWHVLAAPPPDTLDVQGGQLRAGQRVRLHPRPRGDATDALLAGRTGTVDAIDMTTDGEPHVSVLLDDDPGRHLGAQRMLGHRFFFRVDELELQCDATGAGDARAQVLVAGIGNVFFGDDAFGVAVAHLAASTSLPGATVVDFGIRGLDLAYALQDEYDLVILVDAMARGEPPGTLYVLEPTLDEAAPSIAPADGHSVDPVQVLRLARSLGRLPARIVLVGCEPDRIAPRPTSTDALYELSPAVAAALPEAIRLITRLIAGCTPSLLQ